MRNNNTKTCTIDIEDLKTAEYILSLTLDYVEQIGPRDLREYKEAMADLIDKFKTSIKKSKYNAK
jgi:hypothetical protein